MQNRHWIINMLGQKPFKTGLRREIVAVLCIKLILLIFLKLTFFSAPPSKGPDEQARHLIGVEPSPSIFPAQGTSS